MESGYILYHVRPPETICVKIQERLFSPKMVYLDKKIPIAENKPSGEATVINIRQKSRKKYSAEEKIRIVLEGLRGKKTLRR